MVRVRIPHGWQPRLYQQKLWRYLEQEGKRAVAVWHRRAGKDTVALNWTARAAMQRKGMYWHMLPEARQGRKVIWDALDRHGQRLIDQTFPPDIRQSVNETEMKITLKNGALWQVLGSDNYNALVGSNPVGVVFSEYALADPRAWDYIRPILAENDGWAMFIYTARGRNHGATLYEMAQHNPDWFAERLTVDDTGVLSPALIEAERAAGMDEELIRQEFYCSFDTGLQGAYYAAALFEAERQGRVTAVPWAEDLPVHTAWDLGFSDDTAIWFFQLLPGTEGAGQVHVIDYYAASGEAISHYVQHLQAQPYRYGRHWVPHDARPRTLAGEGRSVMEQAHRLGVVMDLVPRHGLTDGIQAVRALLPRCWFDAARCARGLEALRHYRRDWDEDRKTFRTRPRHDWASHGADAFRYLAMGYREDNPSAFGLMDEYSVPTYKTMLDQFDQGRGGKRL